MKKFITLIPIILVMILMLGCSLSDEEKEKQQRYLNYSEKKMTKFLDEEFGKYKIEKIKSITETAAGTISLDLTDAVRYTVKIKGDTHVFYYLCDSDKIYTDMYKEKIENEFKEYIFNNSNLAKTNDIQIRIYGLNNSIDYNIKNLNDFITENKENKHAYTVEVAIAYNNINIKEIDVCEVFKNINNMELYVGIKDKAFDNEFITSTNDEVSYIVNRYFTPYTLKELGRFYISQYDENDTEHIRLIYQKYAKKSINEMTFVYNNDFYDLKLKSYNKESVDFDIKLIKNIKYSQFDYDRDLTNVNEKQMGENKYRMTICEELDEINIYFNKSYEDKYIKFGSDDYKSPIRINTPEKVFLGRTDFEGTDTYNDSINIYTTGDY